MDFRNLLKKYMGFIVYHEGQTFICRPTLDSHDAQWFTEEEYRELLRASSEVEKTLENAHAEASSDS